MRLSRPQLAVAGFAVAMTLAATAPAANAQTVIRPESTTGIAGWAETGSYIESALTAGEGVTTVDPPGGTPGERYRGVASIPLTELTPSGATYQYVHTLVSGELYNNSFDAISPDTQWMVSGEWGTMTHFQVYPAPYFNSKAGPNGATLDLSGYINLNTPVINIQSCDFVTVTKLICPSDDNTKSIFANPFPLLAITLTAPLTGGTVTGTVTDLGSIPQNSACSGTFEPEGADYDTATGVGSQSSHIKAKPQIST